MSLRALTMLVLPLALASEGCTLIGLGIGATSPKYEEPAEASSSPPTGARGQASVPTREHEQPGPPREAPRTPRRVGSYWVEGLVIGAAFDALAITLVAVAAANYHPAGSLTGPFH